MAVSCEVSQELPGDADHLLPALRPVDSSLAFFNNVPSLQSGQLGPHPWGKHVYYATSKYHPARSLNQYFRCFKMCASVGPNSASGLCEAEPDKASRR